MTNIAATTYILILFVLKVVVCWDSNEMQMFDLVEEVNQNFYDYFGISQNATIIEIRKAYRKLSLLYHPDKNPSEEDAVKFRRVVGIYEVLRDEKMRERYDEVLKYGLPDWRMPVFYFRKLRKMSFYESFSLFSLLATVIHYAVLWGVYFEQKLNMEYSFRRKKGRSKTDDETKIHDHLKQIPKPRLLDILPFALVKLFYYSVLSIPNNVKFAFGLLKTEVKTTIDKQFEKQRKAKEKEEDRKRIEEHKRLKKQKKLDISKEQRELRKQYEQAKQNAVTLPLESFADVPTLNETDDDSSAADRYKMDPWDDEDTVLLIRALTKYPQGVRDRWTCISEMLHRRISEITAKVKEVQQNSREGRIPIHQSMQSSVGAHANGYSMDTYHYSTSSDSDDEDVVMSSAQKKKQRRKQPQQIVPITKEVGKDQSMVEEVVDDGEGDGTVVKERKKARTKAKYLQQKDADEHEDGSGVVWSQLEQKQLEDAIRRFPKGTSERWDRIAHEVPTKTKTQCIDRIKKLSQRVEQKRISEQQSTLAMEI